MKLGLNKKYKMMNGLKHPIRKSTNKITNNLSINKI